METKDLSHRKHITDRDVIEYRGLHFIVKFEQDCDADNPWDGEDGHGKVRDSSSREKRPGERMLFSSRGEYWFYDWQRAIMDAKRDGWDAAPYGTGTKGEQAVRAVEADYQYLRGFLRDDWGYVVCTVKCVETNEEDACGGVETYKDYHSEFAWGQIETMAENALKRQAEEARVRAAELTELQTIANDMWAIIRDSILTDSADEFFVTTARERFNKLILPSGVQV